MNYRKIKMFCYSCTLVSGVLAMSTSFAQQGGVGGSNAYNSNIIAQATQQQLQQIRALQQQTLGQQNPNANPNQNIGQNKVNAADPYIHVKDSQLLNEHPQQQKMVAAHSNLSESAFRDMANELLPLTPGQIHRLKQMFSASKAAASAPAGVPPRPVATSQFVNLSPGSTPPVVRLAQGFVTSLMFLDSTGAPWPIAAYDIGDPESFNIQWNKKDNMLMIQSKRQYLFGNMAVRLRGLNTPVMLTLIPGQKAVDYRVDMRVEGIGPKARYLPSGAGLPAHGSNELLRVLDGAAPTGGSLLHIFGGNAKAWAVGDRLYVRTRYTVLSPSWLSTLSSADGMNAYVMYKTPLILASAHGKVIKLKVKGY